MSSKLEQLQKRESDLWAMLKAAGIEEWTDLHRQISELQAEQSVLDKLRASWKGADPLPETLS